MDQPHPAQIKEQGQRQEPVHHLVRVRLPNREFIQEGLVLVSVLGRMRPHVAIVRAIGVQTRTMVEQCVQFMIAHDRHCRSLIAHGADEGQDRPVRAAHIDEVPEEGSDATLRMVP